EKSIEPLRAGQLILIAQHKAMLAIEVAAAVVRPRSILVAVYAPSPSASIAGAVAVGMSESISGQELHPLAQPFGEARFQAVIPGRRLRIGVNDARRGKAEDRRALRDIGDSIGRLSTDRIGDAGQTSLVGQMTKNQM